MMLLRYELRSVSLFTIFRLPVVATGHLNAHSLHGTVVGAPMAPGIPLVAGREGARVFFVYCRHWANRWPNRHHCFMGPVKLRVMFGRRGTLNSQS